MPNINAWVKSLPQSLQTLFYASETAIVAGLIVLLSNLLVAFQNNTLVSFDWAAQLHTLYLAVGAGVLKALLDLLKGLGK